VVYNDFNKTAHGTGKVAGVIERDGRRMTKFGGRRRQRKIKRLFFEFCPEIDVHDTECVHV